MEIQTEELTEVIQELLNQLDSLGITDSDKAEVFLAKHIGKLLPDFKKSYVKEYEAEYNDEYC